ncbi:MAG: hypothetical protein V3V61_01110 [Gammaproteobacteria bacterium]
MSLEKPLAEYYLDYMRNSQYHNTITFDNSELLLSQVLNHNKHVYTNRFINLNGWVGIKVTRIFEEPSDTNKELIMICPPSKRILWSGFPCLKGSFDIGKDLPEKIKGYIDLMMMEDK